MRVIILTFSVFLFSQLLLSVIGKQGNVISGQDVFFITAFTSVFIVIFFRGYHWGRVVTLILLALMSIMVLFLVLGTGDIRLLSVIILYVVVGCLLFSKKIPTEQHTVSSDTTGKNFEFHENKAQGNDEIFYVNEKSYQYPLLLRRYKSILIDGVLFMLMMVVAMVIMKDSPYTQPVIISMAVVFILGYEPLLTSYSATIGQRIMGIRVRDINHPETRIDLGSAYIRTAVKLLLGWLSFITINMNKEHRAIHDFASGSVVIKVH
jgi:uncharacterized RDD family membrane protein YckC